MKIALKIYLLSALSVSVGCKERTLPTEIEQARCAEQAERFVKSNYTGDVVSIGSSLESHFNPTTKICAVKTFKFVSKVETYGVFNAFEGKLIARLALEPGGQTLFCYVKTPEGEKSCKNKAEFEEMINSTYFGLNK